MVSGSGKWRAVPDGGGRWVDGPSARLPAGRRRSGKRCVGGPDGPPGGVTLGRCLAAGAGRLGVVPAVLDESWKDWCRLRAM